MECCQPLGGSTQVWSHDRQISQSSVRDKSLYNSSGLGLVVFGLLSVVKVRTHLC